MSASLRAEIADNLEALGLATGAATLRWVEEYESGPESLAAAELAEEVGDLKGALRQIGGLVTRQTVGKTSLTPAGFRDAIKNVLDDAGI
ncbi:MAG TPA: hypothetical protein VFG35_25080 [Actinoplanes sp.]|nr:hypothetical protein [Actinoplanes sp.]